MKYIFGPLYKLWKAFVAYFFIGLINIVMVLWDFSLKNTIHPNQMINDNDFPDGICAVMGIIVLAAGIVLIAQ